MVMAFRRLAISPMLSCRMFSTAATEKLDLKGQGNKTALDAFMKNNAKKSVLDT